MRAIVEKLCVLTAVILLRVCGGGGGEGEDGSEPSAHALAAPAKACVPDRNCFSLGGTISGLTKSGLVLANGADRVSPPAFATSFKFPDLPCEEGRLLRQRDDATCEAFGATSPMAQARWVEMP